MKPKLLLCPGTGYSATTPLYYTLAVNHRYCHGGFDKEYNLLELLYFKQISDLKSNTSHFRYKFRRHFIDASFDDGEYRSWGSKRERHPDVSFDNKFTKLDSDYYYNRPITIEKYVQYYKEHFDNIKDTYESVCDFSTNNAGLPVWFLRQYVPILQENFDVKVLIINRDPVRRLFSEINTRFQKNSYEFSSAKEMFFHVLQYPTLRNFGLHRMYEGFNALTYQKEVVSNYKQLFTNVLEISMERFWEGKEKLSEFLQYKIDNLFENVYYPFRGSNPIRHRYLAEQWMSDKEDLTEEEYEHAKNYF